MNSVIKILLGVLILLVATSCSDNRNMEKMIPSNATGVICIKVPNFIKKAKLDKGVTVFYLTSSKASSTSTTDRS